MFSEFGLGSAAGAGDYNPVPCSGPVSETWCAQGASSSALLKHIMTERRYLLFAFKADGGYDASQSKSGIAFRAYYDVYSTLQSEIRTLHIRNRAKKYCTSQCDDYLLLCVIGFVDTLHICIVGHTIILRENNHHYV